MTFFNVTVIHDQKPEKDHLVWMISKNKISFIPDIFKHLKAFLYGGPEVPITITK